MRLTFRIPDRILARARAADLDRERRALAKLRNGPKYAAKQMRDLNSMRAMPPQRIVRLVLDPGRGYAVVSRQDSTPDGRLILRASLGRWRFYPRPGIWLPGRIVEDFYANRWKLQNFSKRPRLTATYRLLRAEFGRDAHINFNLLTEYKKPATAVVDYAAPGAATNREGYVQYVVAADGKLIRGSALQVLASIHDWGALARTIGLILVVLALPPMVFALTRLRRSQKHRRAREGRPILSSDASPH